MSACYATLPRLGTVRGRCFGNRGPGRSLGGFSRGLSASARLARRTRENPPPAVETPRAAKPPGASSPSGCSKLYCYYIVLARLHNEMHLTTSHQQSQNPIPNKRRRFSQTVGTFSKVTAQSSSKATNSHVFLHKSISTMFPNVAFINPPRTWFVWVAKSSVVFPINLGGEQQQNLGGERDFTTSRKDEGTPRSTVFTSINIDVHDYRKHIA